MARFVDIDKPIIVPISDEIMGGVNYDKQITLGELFEGLVDGPELEVVDAIPVEWLKNKRSESMKNNWELVDAIDEVLKAWKKEQEAGK